MKKYISISVLIISALFINSCDDYLEEEVETFIEEEVVFTTEEGLESAINGLYQSYADPGYHGSSIHTFIAPLSGKFFSNQGASADATSLNTLPNNTWLTRMWPQMYTTVNVANIIIANIEESNLPNKDRALGEAYFLRGATYFDLVRYFGGVPLKLLPASIDNLNTPRSSKEEVYDAIISDFENAKLMLPNTGEALFQRPVKLAANMFLAKVYMTLASETNNMEMWQAAYDEAIQVYGQYSLVPTFAELYNPLNENTVESIFEIQYATNGAVRNSDIIRSYTLKQFYEYPTFGRIRPNKEVYDQHLNQYPGDPRIAATFIYDSYTKVNGNNQNLYPIQINGNDGYTGLKKYLEPNFNGSTTNRNMLKLRYADLLLMLAEIENELNGPGGAYQYVNEVLARARTQADGTQAAEPADWSGMSQDEFRTRILRERQYELLGENHEWFDTRRRGYEYFLEEVIETHNNFPNLGNKDFTYPVSVKNMLLPIPSTELSNNTEISQADQNPGY
ncbi:RagB/SusD family nutrient uptake outer membrane protein [Winogradskyella sp.]|nr:RagB/SusD family nutrient uptake outer membrane protein [Winogradskyella sp.]MDB9755196.1 RagB/SusD family nutrient uptake outer membrane protein [Winogradskyella sp.]MDB9782536.1 RagB/SusD family nutrient uptake outer membrane protein [Winogradskyella sp.]MDC1505142.1 RagB/SusD family nutrient uptake outer membrane protein [Winogradskyella sp.]